MIFENNWSKMKLLRYILIGIVAAMLFSPPLFSQKLSFVRTDVDSSRSKFITATYIFGIDIYAEDVEHCTNVTFELRYNQTRFVRFSEWKAGNFGPSTKAYILPLIDEANDFGRIVVSCGLDNTTDSSSVSNPRVIHLKFAVIPAAPHFETVNFTIFNPRATVVNDGVPEIIELSAEPVNYTIHSYVNVYPGDADNNGVVDHLDFATVSYYLGMGPNTKKMRSFKREPASTLWAPQAVIAWDTAAATYADADGNGEVNMADNLVVTYNYDKSHPKGTIPSVETHISIPPRGRVRRTANSIALPLTVESYQPYLALSGSIDLHNFQDFDFVGIEPAGIIEEQEYSFAFNTELANSIEFIVGTVDKSQAISEGGVIANLIFEPKYLGANISSPQLRNLKGITPFGQIFDLYAFTSIYDNNENATQIEYTDNILKISNLENIDISNIQVFNITGEMLYSSDIAFGQEYWAVYLPNLARGCYYIRLNGAVSTLSKSFMVY